MGGLAPCDCSKLGRSGQRWYIRPPNGPAKRYRPCRQCACTEHQQSPGNHECYDHFAIRLLWYRGILAGRQKCESPSAKPGPFTDRQTIPCMDRRSQISRTKRQCLFVAKFTADVKRTSGSDIQDAQPERPRALEAPQMPCRSPFHQGRGHDSASARRQLARGHQ